MTSAPANPAMRAKRPGKTAADYLVIAAAPVLIMIVVGSLVLFLSGLSATGAHIARMQWMLFWFVVAIVLVSRIAIEHGSVSATVYGLALAGASALWWLRFVERPLLGLLLLAVAWWCADRLVRDGALTDEEPDVSGEGLLEATGWRGWLFGATPATGRALGSPAGGGAAAKRGPAPKRLHAPGLRVVYFSLAALPLFGLGELALAADDEIAQRRALLFLAAYLGAAIGLLLATSFLGLRRHLRQRHLQMPSAICAAWLTHGAACAGMVLLGCLLLPRPQGTYSLPWLVGRIELKSHPGSSKNTQRGSDPQPASTEAEKDGRGKAEPAAEPARTQHTGTPSARRESSLSKSLERLLYALFACAGAWLVWRYRTPLALAWSRLLCELRALWIRWSGRRGAGRLGQRAPSRDEARVRAFEQFKDPFVSGAASRWPAAELIRYTFAAFEAWSSDHGSPRLGQQTPAEFAASRAAQFEGLRAEIIELGRLYSRVAYGGGTPDTLDVSATVRNLWLAMRANVRGAAA
jgi:hypothetical protein